jgi:hypothetical protein
MRTSTGFCAALPVLVCLCSTGHASTIALNALSNTSNTGYVSWINAQQQAETENVYISQFQMDYTPNGANSSTILYTYCVDLNHSEKLTAPPTSYTVTPTSLTSAFGQTNGNEIGYLYDKYGTTNLAGKATQDAALQLALWDLSVSSRTPTSFSYNTAAGKYTSGDSLFGVSGISSDVATLTSQYLTEAHNQSPGNVVLLQSGPASDTSLQQSVLIDQDGLAAAPEPTAYILFATLLGALWIIRMARSGLSLLKTI